MEIGKEEYEDLTIINGIGEKRQAWLRSAMRIYRIKDLAAMSALTLQKRLEETGQPISKGAADEWIKQAKKLTPEVQFVNDNNNSMFENDVKQTTLPNKVQDWEPVASFVIEYQEKLVEGKNQIRTSVHHVEADYSETWPGVAREQLHDWMIKQAGIQSMIDDAKTNKAFSVKKAPLQLEIKQLMVYQPPKFDHPAAIGEPKQPFLGNVLADKQCVFAVLYQIPDLNGDQTDSDDILAQLYARNVTTDAIIGVPVKSKNKIVPIDKTKRKIEFSQISLPAGSYRLEIILRENKPLSNINYMKFPVLNIY